MSCWYLSSQWVLSEVQKSWKQTKFLWECVIASELFDICRNHLNIGLCWSYNIKEGGVCSAARSMWIYVHLLPDKVWREKKVALGWIGVVAGSLVRPNEREGGWEGCWEGTKERHTPPHQLPPSGRVDKCKCLILTWEGTKESHKPPHQQSSQWQSLHNVVGKPGDRQTDCVSSLGRGD